MKKLYNIFRTTKAADSSALCFGKLLLSSTKEGTATALQESVQTFMGRQIFLVFLLLKFYNFSVTAFTHAHAASFFKKPQGLILLTLAVNI